MVPSKNAPFSITRLMQRGWEAAWQILDDYYKPHGTGLLLSTNLPLNLIDVLGHTHFKEEFKQATYRRYLQS